MNCFKSFNFPPHQFQLINKKSPIIFIDGVYKGSLVINK